MKPRVSVVIPTHNRASLLLRAIKSVQAQTYQDIEIIVVSDGSTDNTESMVSSIDDSRVVFCHHEKPRGASAARNTGIQASKGSFVAFLDDDDEWLSEKLEKQVKLFATLSETVGLVYCWLDYYHEDTVVGEHHPELKGAIFEQALDGQPIGNSSTLMVRRSVIEKVGGFDENLPRGNDGDFIRRVCFEFEVDVVPEVLVNMYVEHGFQRITRFDESGVRNAIKGQAVKLVKFESVIQDYPKQTANIHASMAFHYGQLHEWRNCATHYVQALKLAPFSFGVYRKLIRSLMPPYGLENSGQ